MMLARRTRWTSAAIAAVLVPALLVGAARPAPLAVSRLVAGGSVEEAWLTGASPADPIALLRNGSAVRPSRHADALGALIVRSLTPGTGYRFKDLATSRLSTAFTVLAPGQNPSADSALYRNQPMHNGLNYIRMRDGVVLAATVRYPYGKTCTASAPCPTVIEYSGYGTAGPTDPIPYVISQATGGPCTGCGPKNLLPDSATYVGALVARVAGFATVSLQMRGSGCSGGAFDLFGYPSDYDAYDAIEIVANQAWVAHHHVGMVGISYSGLSELPSAGTDPPGLAAIAPLSPTDDLFSTGFPGGIYNNGFAASWISDRVHDAKPAAKWQAGVLRRLSVTPTAGVAQPWTYYEINAELKRSSGRSSTCLKNQALHDEAVNLDAVTGAATVAPGTHLGRAPGLFDRRSMRVWATHVHVPVFVAGALEDEQTGPQWPVLLSSLPKSTPVFANIVNGNHIDSAIPQIITRWLEFLDVYVAGIVPKDPGGIGDLVLASFGPTAAGAKGAPLPALRFTNARTPALAAADFAAHTPRVEVLFDNGAGSVGSGDMEATYSAGFSAWPPPGGVVRRLYLAHAGALDQRAPQSQGATSVTLDGAARPATSLPPGDSPWPAAPAWDWTTVPPSDGLAFQTAPFTRTTTIVGPATLDLWVRSATTVLDFQVSVTEVRPHARQEEYVTSGFLRSSDQVDRPDSTSLFTDPTYRARDAQNLSATSYTLLRIPVDPIAHTFRKGTELRIVISAPGGDRPVWTFATLDSGQSATVGFGGNIASELVVSESPVSATAAVPACGALRGEPCRKLVAEGNQ
jgi:hypothetical protein